VWVGVERHAAPTVMQSLFDLPGRRVSQKPGELKSRQSEDSLPYEIKEKMGLRARAKPTQRVILYNVFLCSTFYFKGFLIPDFIPSLHAVSVILNPRNRPPSCLLLIT
jgi:hypothetical protein